MKIMSQKIDTYSGSNIQKDIADKELVEENQILLFTMCEVKSNTP